MLVLVLLVLVRSDLRVACEEGAKIDAMINKSTEYMRQEVAVEGGATEAEAPRQNIIIMNMEGGATPRARAKPQGPSVPARPSLIPSLCTHFTRAGIEWRR